MKTEVYALPLKNLSKSEFKKRFIDFEAEFHGVDREEHFINSWEKVISDTESCVIFKKHFSIGTSDINFIKAECKKGYFFKNGIKINDLFKEE